MALKVGELFALISAKDGPFRKTMDDVESRMKSVAQNMTNVGQKMTLALTAPIVAAGAAVFKYGADMDENLNKTKVIFKDQANVMEQWSKTTLRTIGIANVTALDMAAKYGDMATSMKFATKTSADMSRHIVNLAGDMASLKNISIDIADTALTGIFTGETESLKARGIVMTQSILQEYAYSKGIKTSIKNMSQKALVALRLAFVTDALKNSIGDFENTNQSATNQLRIFKEGLKELAVSFKNVLLPTITNVLIKINNLILRLSKLPESVKKVIVVVAGLVAVMGPLLIAAGAVTNAVVKLMPLMRGLATMIKGVSAASMLLVGKFLILAAAGVAIGYVATIIMDNWKLMPEFFSAMWGQISANFLMVKEMFLFGWKAIKLGFYGMMSGILSKGKTGLLKIYDLMAKIPKIGDAYKQAADTIRKSGDPFESIIAETKKEMTDQLTGPNSSIEKYNKATERFKKIKAELAKGAGKTHSDIMAGFKDMLTLPDLGDDELDLEKLIKGANTSDDFLKMIEDMGGDAFTGLDKTGEKVDELKSKIAEMVDATVQNSKNFMDAFGGMFDKVQKFARISPAQLLARQQAKTMAMQEWERLMQQMKAKIGTGKMYSALMEAGPGRLGELRAMSGMTASQLGGFGEQYRSQAGMALTAGAQQTGMDFKSQQRLSGITINVTGNQISSDNVDDIMNQMVDRLRTEGMG